MLNKKSVDDINVKGKKVLVRCDFNVPLIDGKITDENRLVAALPTIKKLIADGGKIILCSHLGKVKTEEDKQTKTLAPVAVRLSELLGQEVKFAADLEVVGPNAKAAVEAMNDGDVVLLENTRFRAEETKNGEAFSKDLASLCDVFVNDAFSYYALSDLANAADYFENSLPCSENPVVGVIDTMIVYYTGVAYNDAGNFAKAKTYFQRCVDLGYMENGDIPAALADILKKEGDIEGAKSCLNAAFQQFPSNQAILVSLINLYLETKDDPTKVLELLHAAQANEPDNASLIYAEGNVYLNLKDYEKAIEFYQKSYDTDNSYFYGIYAVGNTYFELAVQAQTEIDLLDISDISGSFAAIFKFEKNP